MIGRNVYGAYGGVAKQYHYVPNGSPGILPNPPSKIKAPPYGYYGGVSELNHYRPPGAPNYVPQPINRGSVLSESDRALFELMKEKMQFYVEHGPNILLRTNVASNSAENIDSFVMSTSAKPEDKIIYTSNTDVITLNPDSIDGGYF